MITIALTLLSLASLLFLYRLVIGPSVADRAVALDGLLITVVAGILATAARNDSVLSVDTVLLIALVGVVSTGVVGRYIEQRGT